MMRVHIYASLSYHCATRICIPSDMLLSLFVQIAKLDLHAISYFILYDLLYLYDFVIATTQCTFREISYPQCYNHCTLSFPLCYRMMIERLAPMCLLCLCVEKPLTGRTRKKVSQLHNTKSRRVWDSSP